jgi:hypothetical protein
MFCRTTEINMTLHSVMVSTEWSWLNRICGEQWQCFVGFEVLTASTSFWDTTPCIAVEVHWRFGVTYCLHVQDRRVSYSRNWGPLATCLSFGFLPYLFVRNNGELYRFCRRHVPGFFRAFLIHWTEFLDVICVEYRRRIQLRHPVIQTSISIAYFPYFEKVKGGVWDRCIFVCVCLCFSL